MKLAPHPRLYLQCSNAATDTEDRFLQKCLARVAGDAEEFVKKPDCEVDTKPHNAHLIRARRMQGRVLTLLVRWAQTGQETFRQAVLEHIELIGSWQYWSWITWRENNPAPDAIFDLSYGENSATLAIAYDCLHDTLTEKERAMILQVAHERPFLSGNRHCRPGKARWFGKPDSNWNTVCAGGLGMLCLSMYEDVEEAAEILPRVEESVAPFMTGLETNNGAWPEGVGYWNYGMRYSFMYLLSHETASGEAHPLMELDGTRKTLSFPLDFCPRGAACSFGDVNRWQPLPFHYAAAARLGCEDVAAAIDSLLGEKEPISASETSWPDAAEWLVFHRGRTTHPEMEEPAKKFIKHYRGLDWGIVADGMPKPHLYASVRGGTTRVPHGHLDLLSFHCVAGGEKIITNVNNAEYLDTTFSPRRNDIFEIGPQSKNTILINGVGIESGSTLNCTEVVSFPGADGFRLNATEAMGVARSGAMAEFCGRLLLLFDIGAMLIIDRVQLRHFGRLESRLHTPGRVEKNHHNAMIYGNSEKVRIAYDCNVPAILLTAVPAQTTPTAPTMTTLRWCVGRELFRDMVMASLISPGEGEAEVQIKEKENRLEFEVRRNDRTHGITTAKDLTRIFHKPRC